MSNDRDEDEFYEDFGAPVMSDVQLDALLANAQESGNVTLRHLVEQYRTLRFVADEVIQRFEGEECAHFVRNEPSWKRFRFLVRGK